MCLWMCTVWVHYQGLLPGSFLGSSDFKTIALD